jgi:hypothetical protein
MRLSNYRDTYYEFSAKASDVSRTAAFAGVAIAWIFRSESPSTVPKLPSDLLLPILLFATALAFDVLHYVVGTIMWGAFHRYHEKKLKNVNDDPVVSHPTWMFHILSCIFFIKLLLVVGGYIALCVFLSQTWLSKD